MQTVNQKIVLNTLIEHETLTIVDLANEENLGMVPEEGILEEVLKDLVEGGHVEKLDNVIPPTYTITEAGIAEGKKLNEAAFLQGHG